jgi:hypothetical protein
MARIRSVHPALCTDDVLSSVSARAERTFVRLWTQCDDEGRTVDDPRLLKASLYPLHDDVTAAVVDADLCELVAAGLVYRYVVAGRRYLTAKPDSWKRYQKPRRSIESKLPGPLDGTPPPPTQGGQVPTPTPLPVVSGQPPTMSEPCPTPAGQRPPVDNSVAAADGQTARSGRSAAPRRDIVRQGPSLFGLSPPGVGGGEGGGGGEGVDQTRVLHRLCNFQHARGQAGAS